MASQRVLRSEKSCRPNVNVISGIVLFVGIATSLGSSRQSGAAEGQPPLDCVSIQQVYDWLPVFELTTEDVFRVIAEAGQSPHPVYSFGLTRCSCSFCIFASRWDLRRAAELRPDLYAKYAQLERRLAHTLSPTPSRPHGSICRS